MSLIFTYKNSLKVIIVALYKYICRIKFNSKIISIDTCLIHVFTGLQVYLEEKCSLQIIQVSFQSHNTNTIDIA